MHELNALARLELLGPVMHQRHAGAAVQANEQPGDHLGLHGILEGAGLDRVLLLHGLDAFDHAVGCAVGEIQSAEVELLRCVGRGAGRERGAAENHGCKDPFHAVYLERAAAFESPGRFLPERVRIRLSTPRVRTSSANAVR